MGAHEAADRILQNNGQMWRSSEKFEWLQATMPKKRSRTLRPLKDIKNQDPNSKNIFFDNWVDNLYPNDFSLVFKKLKSIIFTFRSRNL